jgi:hypothetical protein
MNSVGNPMRPRATSVLAAEPPPLFDFKAPDRSNCSKSDSNSSSEPKLSSPGSRGSPFEKIDFKSFTSKIKSRLRAPNPTMTPISFNPIANRDIVALGSANSQMRNSSIPESASFYK